MKNDWQPFETAPKDGTECIFWVSSQKGFQDCTANFVYISEEVVRLLPTFYKAAGWYWAESQEPLKRPDLVQGWMFYPQPPVQFSN